MSAAGITGRLARYMVEARKRSLPPDVAREARHRILDTPAEVRELRPLLARAGL